MFCGGGGLLSLGDCDRGLHPHRLGEDRAKAVLLPSWDP